MKRTFICPICQSEIETINDYLASSSIEEQKRIGLSNKKFHMIQHKKQKLLLKKKEMLLNKLKEVERKLD